MEAPALNELAAGYCCIGQKAGVCDVELHAIQEPPPLVLSMNRGLAEIMVYVDNQSLVGAGNAGIREPNRFRNCTERPTYDPLESKPTLDTGTLRNPG